MKKMKDPKGKKFSLVSLTTQLMKTENKKEHKQSEAEGEGAKDTKDSELDILKDGSREEKAMGSREQKKMH